MSSHPSPLSAAGVRAPTVAGVGHSDFGALYSQKPAAPRDPYAIGAEALAHALDDSGLGLGDLDGLICSRLSYQRMATILGLKHLRVLNTLEASGRMSGLCVQYAAMLVATGMADTIACLYSTNAKSSGKAFGAETGGETAAWDQMAGMASLGAQVALMWRRYAETYGAPEDALAPLAISNRRHATLNPNAAMRTPIDTGIYLASRFIAEPLRLYDYCIVSDGAVAIIITTKERARDLAKPPVGIAAMAAMSDVTNFYASTDFFGEASRAVAQEIERQCGLTAADMDCLQIYDNFTPVTLFSIEGLGIAPTGEGWRYVRETDLGFDGQLPVNTSGGHTAECYLQGWALMVEAIRQVRGEAGQRQVPGCRAAQYFCASPIVNSNIFMAL